MNWSEFVPSNAQDRVWDVVVIGTGAGGGPAGFNLARRGRSVLFLERGGLPGGAQPAFSWLNFGGVVHFPRPMASTGKETTKHSSDLKIPVGSGIGGSTSVFGMAMDRFRPIDLVPRRFAPSGLNTSLPEEWPITYEELCPYYDEAEALFNIRGTEDPLMPGGGPLKCPPAPSDFEATISETLTRSGLHPYRIHYACDNIPGCDGCYQTPCYRSCRYDTCRVCVIPALMHCDAKILPNCRVLSLEVSGHSVSAAHCELSGNKVKIRAKVFVLALHALLTPVLLLKSVGKCFPHGLGNGTGLVGRNLMLHVSDTLLLHVDGVEGDLNQRLSHGQSLNDFYIRDGVKLGNIHAHASKRPSDPDRMQSQGVRGRMMFHTIVEDFPYAHNRVMARPGGTEEVTWEYTYPDELRVRSTMLIESFVSALRGECEVTTMDAPGCLNLNRGHACGTCRFGTDHRSSVLDRDNRIHGVDNAYVLDGAFLPSSGGINPSLTIVANSLRASSMIAGR